MQGIPLLDPVATSALSAVLSVIFLTGAWQKLRDLALFQANIDNYRLLPDGLAWPAAILPSCMKRSWKDCCSLPYSG